MSRAVQWRERRGGRVWGLRKCVDCEYSVALFSCVVMLIVLVERMRNYDSQRPTIDFPPLTSGKEKPRDPQKHGVEIGTRQQPSMALNQPKRLVACNTMAQDRHSTSGTEMPVLADG